MTGVTSSVSSAPGITPANCMPIDCGGRVFATTCRANPNCPVRSWMCVTPSRYPPPSCSWRSVSTVSSASRLRMWRRRAAERGRATGGEWQQLSARSKLLRRCAGIAVGIVLAVMLQAIGTLIMDTLSR